MAHNLLLADDSVTIQRVIELTFADEDVNVVAVSDGDQAIARIEQSPPDIVLADIGMPGKNGYEVAQYIKQTPKLSHIPVILLTGAFEPVDQARASEAGCDGVLAKPFEPQLVIGRVRELLEHGPQSAAAAESHSVTAPAPETSPASEAAAIDLPTTKPGAASMDEYFDKLDAAFASLSTGARPREEPVQPTAAPTPVTTTEPTVIPAIDWFASSSSAGSAVESVEPVEPVEIVVPAATVQESHPPVSYASPVEALQMTPEAAPEPATEVGTRPGMGTHPGTGVGTGLGTGVGTGPATETGSEGKKERERSTIDESWREVAPAQPLRAVAPAPKPAAAASSAAAQPAPSSTPAPPVVLPLADAFAALLTAEQTEPQAASTPAWPTALPSRDELVEQVTRLVLERLTDRTVRETVSQQVSQIAERLVRDEIERIKAAIR